MNERDLTVNSSLTTRLLSAAILLLASVLVGVTTLHWGGMVPEVSVWLFPAGAALWALILIAAARNIKRGVVSGGWVEVFVLAWLAYAMFQYFRAPAEYVARWEWMWILVYAGLFIALRNFVHAQRWHYWLLAVILACAVAACIFGLFHREAVYEIWGLKRPDYGTRISGTFGCPNHFGNFLAISGLVAIGFGFFNKLKWPLRLVCFYLFALFTVGIFYSYSRGSVLAWTGGIFMATLFLFVDQRTSWKLKLAFLLAIIIGLAGCVFVVANNEFAMSRVEQAMRGDIRLLLAEDALRIWQDHKLLGSGMATFDFWHQRLHQAAFYGRAIYTHNDYLNLLADYGAAGAAIVLGFFSALIMRLRARTRRELEPADQQIAVRIAWCVLAAMAVHATFDFNFHIPACALAFFAVMAAGAAQIRRRTAASWPAHVGGVALIVSALVALFFLTTLTAKTWQSLSFFKLTEEQIIALTPQEIEAEVQRIKRLDPTHGEAIEKAGDAVRVQAAALNPKISAARKANDTATLSALLVKREQLGQLALGYYAQAQAINPLSDNPLLKQAIALDTLERYQEAYLCYVKALQHQPYNAFFHYYYGFHLAAVGEYDLARKEFETAMRTQVVRNSDKEIRALAKKALKALP